MLLCTLKRSFHSPETAELIEADSAVAERDSRPGRGSYNAQCVKQAKTSAYPAVIQHFQSPTASPASPSTWNFYYNKIASKIPENLTMCLLWSGENKLKAR